MKFQFVCIFRFGQTNRNGRDAAVVHRGAGQFDVQSRGGRASDGQVPHRSSSSPRFQHAQRALHLHPRSGKIKSPRWDLWI